MDKAGFPIFYLGLWTGLFLSLALYDWKTLGRSHPVTLAGPAWFALTWLISALGWRCRQIAGDLPRLKPLLSGEDAAMRPARFSTPPRTLAPVRRSATQPTFAEAPHVSIQSVGGVPVLPRHRLSCHCGAVVLELELPDGIVDPRRCDCSICRRKGAVVASVPLSGIRILQGAEHLRLYQFNTRVARHYFCGRCGIYTHHQRRSFPDQYGYNVGCLEGINPFLLPDVPVNDGIHHPADRPRPAAN